MGRGLMQSGGYEAGEVGHVHQNLAPTSSAISFMALKSSMRGGRSIRR